MNNVSSIFYSKNYLNILLDFGYILDDASDWHYGLLINTNIG
jgi:hypothetical protein